MHLGSMRRRVVEASQSLQNAIHIVKTAHIENGTSNTIHMLRILGRNQAKEMRKRCQFLNSRQKTILICIDSVLYGTTVFLVELLDPLFSPRFVWSTSAQRRGSKMDSWRGSAPWLVLFSGTATSWDSRRCAGTFWVTRSYQRCQRRVSCYIYISILSTGTRVQGLPTLPGYVAFFYCIMCCRLHCARYWIVMFLLLSPIFFGLKRVCVDLWNL